MAWDELKGLMGGDGFGQATVDKINEELKSKFNDSAPQISEKLMPDDIIAYSLLLKNLRSEELSKQVLVYDYVSDNNFIIKLLTDDDKDEIILAKVEPSETLYQTYDSAMKRMSTPKKYDIRDALQIPVVSFNIGRDYTPSLPGTVMNDGFEGYFFKKAYQRTKFVLDESGAKLASEATILLPSSVYTPKNLVLNKSFLLVMKEKNAEKPYLMVWVDNPELLIQAK